MSRRAKARRAQSAEPGERGGSVDPPPASVRENNQNRGSEETLEMSSVMATDMQQGGGPKMKRNQAKRKTTIKEIGLADLEFLSDDRGNYISFFIAADPKPQPTVASGGGFGSMLMGTEGMSKAATNAESSGITVNVRGLDVGSDKEKAAHMSHLLAAAEQKVVEWSASGARKDDALAKLTAEKDALLAEKESLAAEKNGLVSTAASSAELESKLAKCDADLAAAAEASSKLSQELADATAAVEAANAKVSALEAAAAEAEAAGGSTAEAVAEVEAELSALKRKADFKEEFYKKEKDKHKAALGELEEQIAALEASSEESRLALEAAKQDLEAQAAKAAQVDELTASLAASQVQSSDLEAKLTSLQSEGDDSAAEVVRLQAALEAAKAEVETAQADAAAAKVAAASAAGAQAAGSASNDHDALAAAQATVAELTEAQAQTTAAAKASEEKAELASARVAALEAQVSELTSSLADAKATAGAPAAATSDDGASAAKMKELQAELDEAQEMMVTLQERTDELEEELETAKKDGAAAAPSPEADTAAVAKLEAQVSDLKASLEQAKKEAAEAKAALSSSEAPASNDNSKAAKELSAAQAQIKELEESLKAASGDGAAAAKAKELQTELDEAQEMMVTLQERTDELEEELEKAKKDGAAAAPSPEADTAAVAKLEAHVSDLLASLEQAKKEAAEAKSQHEVELKKGQNSLGAQNSSFSADAAGPPGGQSDNHSSADATAALELKVDELKKQLEAAKVAAAAQAQELQAAREAASNAPVLPAAAAAGPEAAAAAASAAAPPIKVMIPEREGAGFVCGFGGKVEAVTKGSKVAKAEVPVGWRLCKIGKEAVSAKLSKKSLETKLASTRNLGKKYSLTFEDPSPPPTAPAAAATTGGNSNNSNPALEAQVAHLTKALAAAQAQVDELQSSLNAAGDNSAAAAKVVELQAELDEAQEMMVTLQERTDELEEELETAKKDGAAAAPSPEADTAAVAKLEAQVSDLKASLEQAKKEAAEVRVASGAPAYNSNSTDADLSTVQAQLLAAQDLAAKSAAQIEGLEGELAASQKHVDQQQVALAKERERINEKVAEIEAAMKGQGAKLQSTEVEAKAAEMAKESVARETAKNKASEEKLQAVVAKLEKELEAAKAAKEVASLGNAQGAPGPQASGSDIAGEAAAAAAVVVLEKQVESLEAELTAARNSAKGAFLEAQKGGGNAKLEKEVAELKKKEQAMETQIKKLKAEVIDGEKDEHSLEAKVVKLQKTLHTEEEKTKTLKEAAKASEAEVKTLKQEVKTLRTNLNKMSDSAVKLVKKLEGQVEKLESEVKKEAKEQDHIMSELHKLQHMEKEADKLEHRAEENDKKLDAQAATAKKTRKALRDARKNIAAIDTDSEEEEEPPPPPVKMNMAFEGLTAEDFTEEKKEQMMKDLATAYGIADWRLVKIKGLKVGSLVLDIEVEGFEDHNAAKKFSKVSSLEPPPMDEAIYGKVQAKVDKIVNPRKAMKAELEKFKAQVAEDEARIAKLHASLGELDSDLAATKASLQEASAVAAKESARAVALEGAAAEAQKSIQALSSEGGADEALAQRVAELSASVASKDTELQNALAEKAALESKLEASSSGADGSGGGGGDQPPGAQANDEQAAELAEAQEMLLMLQERIDELQPLETQVAELNRQLAAQGGDSSGAAADGSPGGDKAPGTQASEEQAAELAEAQEMLLMLQERIDELQPLETQVAELNRQLAALGGAAAVESSGAGDPSAQVALQGRVAELEAALAAASQAKPSGEDGGSDQPPGAQASEEQAAELAEAQEMLLMLQERIDELEPLETRVAELAAREADLKRQLAVLDGGTAAAAAAGAAGASNNVDDENAAGALNSMVAGNDVEGHNPDGMVMEDHDLNPLVAGAQEDDDKAAPEPSPPLVVTMDGGKPAGFTFDAGSVVVKATKSGAVAVAGVKAGWRLVKVEKTAVKATEKKMQIDAKLNKARISGKKYTLTFDPPAPSEIDSAAAGDASAAAAPAKPAAAKTNNKAAAAAAPGKKVPAAAAQAMEEELNAARASAAALTAAKEDLEKQVAALRAAAASAGENDEMMMMLQERIDELEPLAAKVVELQAAADASAERITALESTKDPDLLEVQKLLASAQAERDVASARVADLEAAAAAAGAGGPGAQVNEGEGVNPLIGSEDGEAAGAQAGSQAEQGNGDADVPAAELSLRQALATANERASVAEKKVAELQATVEAAQAAAAELEESMIAMADEGESAARVFELQKLLDEATTAKVEALKRAEAADDAEGAAKLLLKRLQKENRKSIASEQKLVEVQSEAEDATKLLVRRLAKENRKSMTNASARGGSMSVVESAAAAAAAEAGEAGANESENALLLVIGDLEERVASMNEAKMVADEKIDELMLELEKARQSSPPHEPLPVQASSSSSSSQPLPDEESQPAEREEMEKEEVDDDSVDSDEQPQEQVPAPAPQLPPKQPQEQESKSPEEQLIANKEALQVALERAEEAETALVISQSLCTELKASIEAVGDGNGSEVLFRLQKDLVTSQTQLRTAVAKKQTLEERVLEVGTQISELAAAQAKAESDQTAAETVVSSLKLEASAAKVKQMEAEKVQSVASEQAFKLQQALDLAQEELATQATSLEALRTGDDAAIVQRVSNLQKELKACRAQMAVSEQSMDTMTKAAEAMERTASEREIERDALERKLVNVRAEKAQLVEQAQVAAAIARAQSMTEAPKEEEKEEEEGKEKKAVVETPLPASSPTATAAAATTGGPSAAVSSGAHYSALAESKVVAAQASLLVAEGRARSADLELSKCQRKMQELERTLAALQPSAGATHDPPSGEQSSSAAAARLVDLQDDLVSASSEVDAQKQRAEEAELAALRLKAEAAAAVSRCEALEAALVKATGSSKAAAAATKAAQDDAAAKATVLASDAAEKKESSNSSSNPVESQAAALEAAEARAVAAERQAAEAASTLKEAMADEGNLFERLLNLHNELVEARGAADAAAREAAIALKRWREAESSQRAAEESSYKYQSEALTAAASLAMAEQRASDLDAQIAHAKQQERGARAALAALTANASGDAAGTVVQDLVDAKASLEEQVSTLTKSANKAERLEKDMHSLETKVQALERQLVRQYSDLAAKQEVLDQEKAANLLLAEAKASRLESSLLAATRAQAVTEASVAALLSSSSGKEGASGETTTKSIQDGSSGGGGVVKMSASEVATLKEQASASVHLQASLLVAEAKSVRLMKQLDAAARASKKREEGEQENDDDDDEEISAPDASAMTSDALHSDANSNLEADLVSAKASFLVAEAKCWQLENELAAAQARADAATRALKAVDESGSGEASEVAAALAAAQTAFADKLAGMAAALEVEAADRAVTERNAEVAATATSGGGDGSRLQARLTAKQEGEAAAALSPEEESSRLQARLDAKAAAEEAGKGIEATPETNAAATKLQGRARMKVAKQDMAQKKLGAVGGENKDPEGAAAAAVNLEARVAALTEELQKEQQQVDLLKEAAVALNGGDDAMVKMLQGLEDKVVSARDQAQAADARTLAAQAAAKEAANKAAKWQAKVSALEHCLVQAATLTSSSSSPRGMGANDETGAKAKLAAVEKEVSVLRNALSSAHEAAAASGSDVSSLNARLQQELVASQLQHATRDATLLAAEGKTSELQQKVRALEATLVEAAAEDQSEDTNHASLLAAAQLEASEAKAELLQEAARRAARVSEIKSLQSELVRAQRVAAEAKKSLDLMAAAAASATKSGAEGGEAEGGEGIEGGESPSSALDARTANSMARLDELHRELAKAQEAAEAGKEAFKDLSAAEEQRDKLFKDKRKLESKIKKLQAEVKKQTDLAKAVTSAAGSSGGSSGNAAITATIRVVFKKYDKDHSGSIDASELRAVMDDLGIELDDEQADRVYRAVDKDNSGQIDIEEFAAWWHDRNSVMFTSAESASELLAQVAAAEALAAGHQLDKQTWQAKCSDLEEQLEAAQEAAMVAPKAPVGAKELAETAKAQGLTHELQAMYASELAAARATEKLVHDRIAALKVAAGQRAENKPSGGDGHLSAIAEGDEVDDDGENGDGNGAKTSTAAATKKASFPPATEEEHVAATKIQGKARQKKAKQRFFNKKAAAEVCIEATPETNAAATKLQGRARMKASKKDVATRKAKTQEARAAAGPSEDAAAAALASEAEAGYEAELLDTERMLRKLRGNIQELEAAQILAEGAPEQLMEARARQELVQENEDLREIANSMADEREELLEELTSVRGKLARAEVMAGLDPSSGEDPVSGDYSLGVGGDRNARDSSSSALAVLNVTPEMLAELPALEQELERLDAEASVLDDAAQAAEGNQLEAADALTQVIDDLASAETDVADATTLVDTLKAEIEAAKAADARGAQAEATAAAMGGSGSSDEWQGALEKLKTSGETMRAEHKTHEDACQAATVRLETCERETNAATVQQLMHQEAIENAPLDEAGQAEVASLEQKSADLDIKLGEIAAEKQSAERALSEAQAQLADCQERLSDNEAALIAVERQVKLLEPTATLAEAADQRMRLQQLHKECERQNAAAEELLARAEAELEAKRLEADVIAQRVEDIRYAGSSSAVSARALQEQTAAVKRLEAEAAAEKAREASLNEALARERASAGELRSQKAALQRQVLEGAKQRKAANGSGSSGGSSAMRLGVVDLVKELPGAMVRAVTDVIGQGDSSAEDGGGSTTTPAAPASSDSSSSSEEMAVLFSAYNKLRQNYTEEQLATESLQEEVEALIEELAAVKAELDSAKASRTTSRNQATEATRQSERTSRQMRAAEIAARQVEKRLQDEVDEVVAELNDCRERLGEAKYSSTTYAAKAKELADRAEAGVSGGPGVQELEQSLEDEDEYNNGSEGAAGAEEGAGPQPSNSMAASSGGKFSFSALAKQAVTQARANRLQTLEDALAAAEADAAKATNELGNETRRASRELAEMKETVAKLERQLEDAKDEVASAVAAKVAVEEQAAHQAAAFRRKSAQPSTGAGAADAPTKVEAPAAASSGKSSVVSSPQTGSSSSSGGGRAAARRASTLPPVPPGAEDVVSGLGPDDSDLEALYDPSVAETGDASNAPSPAPAPSKRSFFGGKKAKSVVAVNAGRAQLHNKLMEERAARRQAVNQVTKYVTLVSSMHERMVAMARVHAAKEAGRAKLEELEKKQAAMVASQSDLANLSIDQISALVLQHKEETAAALVKAATSTELSRTERARAESLSVDLRALRGDYARLSDALLHLQTERLELKAAADLAIATLAPTKDKANKLELSLSFSQRQQAQLTSELEALQSSVAKAVAKHGVEKDALRQALSGAKDHIVALEARNKGLNARLEEQTKKSAALEKDFEALLAVANTPVTAATITPTPKESSSKAKKQEKKTTAAKEAKPTVVEATEEEHVAATKIQGKARQKKAKERFINKKAAAEVSIEATPETNAAATKLQGRARIKAAKQNLATKRAGLGGKEEADEEIVEVSDEEEDNDSERENEGGNANNGNGDGSDKRAEALAHATVALEARRLEAVATAQAEAAAVSSRLAASEARVMKMAAERKKLVFALEAAKGHIVKLTGRLAVGDDDGCNEGSSSSSRSQNPRWSSKRSSASAELTRKHVRASLASLAPGAMEAALAEQAAAEEAAPEARVAAVLGQENDDNQMPSSSQEASGISGGLGFGAFDVFGAVGDFDLESFVAMGNKADQEEEEKEETKGTGPADEASIFSFFGL